MTREHDSASVGDNRAAACWLLCWTTIAALILGGTLLGQRGEPSNASPANVQTVSTHARGVKAKPIEDVRAGERVWAFDPETETWSPRTVLEPMSRDYEGDLVTIAVAGETIEATDNHPFWVTVGSNLDSRPSPERIPAEAATNSHGRWVDARHLEVGDLLTLESGGSATVEQVIVRQSRKKVYNLEVADLHTYAVGNLGIAVHNCPTSCFPPGTLVLMGDGTAKPIERIVPGDEVLSRDVERSADAHPSRARVSALIKSSTLHLVKLTLRQQMQGGLRPILRSTRLHPFWSRTRGWVYARNLTPGDRLEDGNGREVIVDAVEVEDADIPTFNLTVESSHTFYVESDGVSVLVHNGNPPMDPSGQFVFDWATPISFNSPGSTVHGNSFNYPGTTDLYARYNSADEFQKWGITNDLNSRYSSNDL